MGTLGKDQSWTDTYERWDTWKDPEDEAAEKREAEKKHLRENLRKHSMSCNHDRSAERKLMDMSTGEKIKACREFRHKGNLFHGEGQYRRAALQYRQALINYDFCFPEESSEQQELDEIRQACLLNSAACFLACQELDETLDCCYQALREDPENAKALYRRAVVHRMRDQFEEASTDLAKALALIPNDIALRKENAILKSKIASYRARSKIMGERIFRTGQQEASREAALPSNDLGSPTLHSDNIVENASKTSTNSSQDVKVKVSRDGAYIVTRAGPAEMSRVDCGAGSEKDEGRRRHDLFSPVCVDLSQVESIAGCSWSDVSKKS